MAIATIITLAAVLAYASFLICRLKRKLGVVREKLALTKSLYENEVISCDKLLAEIHTYEDLCKSGYMHLMISQEPFATLLTGNFRDMDFVIKRFDHESCNKDDIDFALREAEELKEIIENF